jgi:hypothetical protein
MESFTLWLYKKKSAQNILMTISRISPLTVLNKMAQQIWGGGQRPYNFNIVSMARRGNLLVLGLYYRPLNVFYFQCCYDSRN